MDIRIYICTHKAFYAPEDPLYHPLQVGRALHDDLGYECDNTGENISEKNETFCELTGLYWIWKNVDCDIIGTCHYRRYFCVDGDIIRKHQIEHIFEKYDVITSAMAMTESKSVGEDYRREHNEKDLDCVRGIIEEKYPECLDSFDEVMQGNLMAGCNMMIMRKPIFDEYCQWLFGILLEAEKRCVLSGYDEYQKRVFGFLGERLQLVFLREKKYRIKVEKIEMTNLDFFQFAHESVKEKKDILKKLLNPVLYNYAVGKPVDLLPLKPINTDFHGKIPIWICWWQGEDAMPPIVRACFESLRRNLSKERTEIRLITFENVGDYVLLPDFIEEKYRQEIITLTHLSDILRMSLLTLYGGLWLDATYLMTEPFDIDSLLCGDLYTQKFRELRYSDEMVVKGRWAGNLLYVKAWNPLTRFVLNGFYCYWAVNTKLIDYFLIDYLILIAYEEIPFVREMIESCPPSEPNVFELEPRLNEAYDENEWKRLTRETSLFKLSYKHNFEDYTKDGKITYYRKIMDEYGDRQK